MNLPLLGIATIIIGTTFAAFFNGHFNGGFIFAYMDTYYAAMLPVFIALLPICWVLFSRPDGFWENLRKRGLSKLIRAILFPFSILLSAFFIVTSPLGWVSAYAWLNSLTTETMPAKIITIEQLHRSGKGCKQNAVLSIAKTKGSICIENRLIGPSPSAGQAVTVTASKTSLGYYIREVSAQHN